LGEISNPRARKAWLFLAGVAAARYVEHHSNCRGYS
jgi:hypothetical protein